jgi:hypothetical protein
LGTATRFRVAAALLALGSSALATAQDLPAPGTNAPAASDASAAAGEARRRYELLLEQAEGRGRTCMISNAGQERSFEQLLTFLETAEFVELRPDRPITVVLPEHFYSPAGRTLSFDELAIAINSEHPSEYISLTRTADGVLIEPKVALPVGADKIVCVRNVSSTKPYK